MTPTIADVARAAGVSTATVSRVLNGNKEVNRELADRVHKAVSELFLSAFFLSANLFFFIEIDLIKVFVLVLIESLFDQVPASVYIDVEVFVQFDNAFEDLALLLNGLRRYPEMVI